MNQTWYAEDADPQDAIQILQTLQAKYTSAGKCLKLAWFTAIILSAMPDHYQSLIHTLIASTWVNKLTLKPNDLISHITKAAKHDFAQEQAKKDNAALMLDQNQVQSSYYLKTDIYAPLLNQEKSTKTSINTYNS
jgi:hypothetical protein